MSKARNARIHENSTTQWLDKVWDAEIDAAIERISECPGATQAIDSRQVRLAAIEAWIAAELR